MLAAIDIGAFVWVIVIFVMLVPGLLAKRAAKKFRNSLELRDGRVVLRDDARLKLGRSPRRLSRAESLIAKSFEVNERGEIVERAVPVAPTSVPWYKREISLGKKSQTPPSAFPSTPEVEKIAEKERFRSAWDEQESAPSIWDENDANAFWSDAEKSRQRSQG